MVHGVRNRGSLDVARSRRGFLPETGLLRSSIATGAALDGRLRALFEDLTSSGVRYALMRAADGASHEGRGQAEVLVSPDDLGRLEALVSAHLDPTGSREDTAGRHRGDGGRSEAGASPEGEVDEAPPPVAAVTKLLYGGARLATGEAEDRILGRAISVGGVMRPSPADELLDLLLHCMLDLGHFPTAHRIRLSELVDELRNDPPAAGRAAERTQQELAPVVTWEDLLSDVLHERWGELRSLRHRLRVQLFSRQPVASLLRRTSPRRRSRTAHAPPKGSRPGQEAGNGAPGGTRPATEASERLNRKQIRGSGLLLAGRVLSTGLKFVAEVLVVRYLTTAAYGSWTWALSAVLLLESFSTMGLNRAIPRFVPLHLERREREKLFGVLLFVLGTLLTVGLLFVTVFHAFPEWVARLAGASPGQPLDILFIVIFLIPIQGVGNFCTVLCAALGDSRTIFIRRYVLHPGLILLVALILVLMEADVRLLAYGWVLASLAGILYYSVSVFLALRRQGLLAGGLNLRMALPVRRVLAYTVPVMGSDWFRTLMTTPAPLLLGYFSGMSTVAMYQVVIPLVALNTQVSQSFAMLFEPSASRVLARGDREGLDNLYWRSAVWVAVLSFPAFAVTFATAEPLTLLLYGERYQAAAPILSLLAVGMFLNAALGFNDATLRVSGNIRWLMGVNIVGAVLNIGLNLLLIPPMGALGAGIATGTAMLIYAVLKQYCLWRATGVRALHPGFVRIYALIALLVAGLALLRVVWPRDLWILLPGVVLSVLTLALLARAKLSISDTFPELVRWPLLKRLLG